jgi:hypothetical protein
MGQSSGPRLVFWRILSSTVGIFMSPTDSRLSWFGVGAALWVSPLLAACGGRGGDTGLNAPLDASGNADAWLGHLAPGDASLDTGPDGSLGLIDAPSSAAIDAPSSGRIDGPSTGAPDATPPQQVDATPQEASGPAGCTPGMPCVNETNGSQGVCTRAGGVCGACANDPNGDGTCAAAYGAPFLCTNGACTRGTCGISAECDLGAMTGGQLCAAGRCVPCGADYACSIDAYYQGRFPPFGYPGGAMCNKSTGRCASSTCNQRGTLCGTAPNTNGNDGDICCADPNHPGLACIPGQCCVDSDCPQRQSCLEVDPFVNGIGTKSCVPACNQGIGTLDTILVDPVGGIDDAQTNGGPQCAFRSLTHALAAVVKAGLTKATIAIANDKSAPSLGVNTGEVFPVTIPSFGPTNAAPYSVTIQPSTTGLNTPILLVPAGQTGIVASDSNLLISNLIVDGQNQQGSVGIAIYGSDGSDGNNSQFRYVTVQGMASAGIVVGTAPGQTVSPHGVVLGPGVVAQHNGTAGTPASGLRVYAHSNVSIEGDVGGDHTSFSGNSQYGIVVGDQATVQIQYTIDFTSPKDNGVDADGNAIAGLWIAQDAATVAATNLNSITGLHATGNQIGLRVGAGSYLQLRGSFLGNNTQAGIVVASSGGAVDDLATIDLGNRIGASYGQNVLVANASTATGICLQLGTVARTLLAAGNIFGTTDCSASATALRRSLTCAPNTDIGGLPITDMSTIDVSNCK